MPERSYYARLTHLPSDATREEINATYDARRTAINIATNSLVSLAGIYCLLTHFYATSKENLITAGVVLGAGIAAHLLRKSVMNSIDSLERTILSELEE